MHELLTRTLVELTADVAARRVSPVEVMEATLARIDEANPDINAVVAMHPREKLLAEARESEQRVMRGEARPLEGMPLGVKDLENTVGLVNSHGSLPFKDNLSTYDDVHVARLKAAGAIVVGKTNAPEFGYTAITKNLVYGVTRSPWNLDRTPGGSSGGSAAAMAAGMLPLVTSSDGGGSIRLPAAFSGCFGLKTSFGRVPIGPSEMWPFGDTGVYGPTTKTVEDAALWLDQVVGAAPEDPNSLPHPGYRYQDRLNEPLPKLRIGYSPDLGFAVVQSEVQAAVENGLRVFEKLGHTVEEFREPLPNLGAVWSFLGSFQQRAALEHLLPEHEHEFGYTYIAGVKNAEVMSATQFGEMARARMVLNRWCQELFSRFDILITPTTPYEAPPAKGPFWAEIEGKLLPPFSVAAFTIPFNFSWHPASSVRAGLTKTGMPIGMQIVGPRHRDDLVLQASLAYERECPWHPQWPTTWSPLPE